MGEIRFFSTVYIIIIPIGSCALLYVFLLAAPIVAKALREARSTKAGVLYSASRWHYTCPNNNIYNTVQHVYTTGALRYCDVTIHNFGHPHLRRLMRLM